MSSDDVIDENTRHLCVRVRLRRTCITGAGEPRGAAVWDAGVPVITATAISLRRTFYAAAHLTKTDTIPT
jgi:hypothetical protein